MGAARAVVRHQVHEGFFDGRNAALTSGAEKLTVGCREAFFHFFKARERAYFVGAELDAEALAPQKFDGANVAKAALEILKKQVTARAP